MRLSFFSAVLPFLSVVVAASAQVDEGKKDHEAIQGTWEVLEFVQGGKPAPEATRKEMMIVFKGEKMTLTGPEGIGKREYSFRLDPSKKPKAIDVTPLEGQFKGKTSPAIYELKSDELKLCVPNRGNDRPAEFKSAEGSNLGLFVLKRSKK
jgi:uncharacterized protein (TIGR03067 family)